MWGRAPSLSLPRVRMGLRPTEGNETLRWAFGTARFVSGHGFSRAERLHAVTRLQALAEAEAHWMFRIGRHG